MTTALATTQSVMLTAALAYAAQGWRVFPCHTPHPGDPPTCSCRSSQCGAPGKHPRTMNGFQDATTDVRIITQWWTNWPDANIGGIPASAGFVVFDLDTDEAMVSARALGLYAEPTMEVQTGNGTHRYYRHPPLPSGATIGGIVVRSNHGYVLLPPSLHASGRRYAWATDAIAISLPAAALEAALKATSKSGARERVLHATSGAMIAPGDRHAALLAIAGSLASSQVPEPIALQLTQDANQARCTPPKPPEEVANIVAFAYSKERDKHAEIARHLLIAHSDAVPVHTNGKLVLHPTTTNPLADSLPGVLEDITAWSLKIAPQPVRLYGVAAALGLASVVCARRYVTTRRNLSTLYLLIVGKSGTGKEHVRRTAHALLRAANAESLIGPNEWTSRSAVWSSVFTQPQSLAVVDEFGQFLGAASGGSDGATMKNGVLTALMELFGRIDDFAITPQFSSLTLTEKQRKQTARKVIERPALSLVGLTTPAEWYDSLKASRISSGFLNRFLVLEADVPRGDLAPITDEAPPDHVVAWLQLLLMPRGELDLLNRVTEIPAATLLQIDDAADQQFVQFKRDCNRRADRLEREGLGELPVRAAEQAMRLALIASLARDPDSLLVSPSDAEWGVAVASYLLSQLIPSVQERLADSPLHALRNRFLAALRDAGDKGLTNYELMRCSVFRGTDKRNRDETIQWVQETRHAAWGEVAHENGKTGGRPRYALRVFTDTTNVEVA